MSEKQSYPKFQELLKTAVARSGDSKKVFASRIGITPEHLSRLLNAEQINRPSKMTLKRILDVSPDIIPLELYESCGYNLADWRMNQLLEIRKMSPKERMDKGALDIKEGFQHLIDRMDSYPNIYSIMSTYAGKFALEVRQVFYDESRIKPNGLKPRWKGDWVLPAEAVWQIKKDVQTSIEVHTYFALFFVRLENNAVMPVDIALDADTLTTFGFVPSGVMDSLYEDGYSVKDVPYVSVSKIHRKTELSKEERLLQRIFGEDNTENHSFYSLQWGYGSVWKETPSLFASYVLNNDHYFGSSEFELEILEDLRDYPDTYKENEEIMNRISMYSFSTVSGELGIVYAILTRKFREAGYDFELQCDVSVMDAPMPLFPVLYVDEDYCMTDGLFSKERRDKLDSILKPEFKALGLTTYGTTLSYTEVGITDQELSELQMPIDVDEE